MHAIRPTLICLLSAAIAASPAYGRNGPAEAPGAVEAAAETPREAPAPEPALLSDEELQAQRGGYTIIVNNQTLIGVVQGTSFNGDYVAGGVSFNNDAFSNFSGLLAIAINTGLQSNALAGMSVTINVND